MRREEFDRIILKINHPRPRYQLTYREFVIYQHDISEKNVVKFTYHEILKKLYQKIMSIDILSRHIRNILKKYITMKYRDISVKDINDILN